MKIAALQMVSGTEVEANLAAARRLIAQAAAEGAKLVALPEYFCFMGHADIDKLAVAETAGRGPIQRMLAEAAREHAVWVIGGTLPLQSSDPQRVLNSCCVFGPDGGLAARYDKIHLFRFERDSAGVRESYDEGRAILAGTTPTTCQAAGLRVGLSVCYDLRFPELYRALMTPPCDLLSVPSAFTYTTGQAHWELLLRARAIENQCYVVAPAQGGRHENGRRTWGHSMIVDPWGEVLAVRPEGEGVVLAELDETRIAQVRGQLPALTHRRG
ncbi:carbon-nitrogen hydrolase family protein [uncultured Piscinibacter sp.]|uniref:carbon-nitrogen hydrolase family protein n=1 Tax=uncultured Piscinibacter sp. TaxID=1131835 RepID=UPI002624E935|nr:carbon-nitrogen hydrolase family protein [uncultured Piscinibacter sp.]